jgi:hypothetical protein
METHPQELHKTPGHGWKHYMFEFFMLFLAVFFGFLAENIRENIAKRDREKHYIESILSDLRTDTANLALSLKVQGMLLRKMDGVLRIPIQKLKDIRTQDTLYQNLVPFYSSFWVFVPDINTVTQLKNAGGFNIFSNQKAMDSIGHAYYYYDSWVKINSDIYVQSHEKTNSVAIQLVRLPETTYAFDDSAPTAIPDNAIVLIQFNTLLFEQFYSNIRYQKGSLIACIETEKEYGRRVERLLKFLGSEYGLK